MKEYVLGFVVVAVMFGLGLTVGFETGYLFCKCCPLGACCKQVGHRCECGCEKSGQCTCPNCSVGCGFMKPDCYKAK